MIRNTLSKKFDFDNLFAIWRVDAPWQACTKRVFFIFTIFQIFSLDLIIINFFSSQPIGFTLGGGKGSIHHYVTPVSAGRMIIELGGHAEYNEVHFYFLYYR